MLMRNGSYRDLKLCGERTGQAAARAGRRRPAGGNVDFTFVTPNRAFRRFLPNRGWLIAETAPMGAAPSFSASGRCSFRMLPALFTPGPVLLGRGLVEVSVEGEAGVAEFVG
ncbi:hypothetical protein J7I98_37205 [Streptomyces sp. ISL-98]|uniref:hypothetical protein n=1 Tax=Streptomyces sp. ISL-98 TaxID=2819192 RepID=UPI001BE7BFBD|nr:hypothetical protein [Streptomyces sp. ISL-98]MBT2511360.1 hypothetical protein [Streptomyces sp. ISL-98]